MSNFLNFLVLAFLLINLIGSPTDRIQPYCRRGLQLEYNYYALVQIDMEVNEIQSPPNTNPCFLCAHLWGPRKDRI